MSDAQRPALQRKDTRKTKEKRNAALDSGVKVIFSGEEHQVRLGDITPLHARRFRREYGCSFTALMEELSEAPDIDSVAALVWMSRIVAGDEGASFEDVQFSYADLDDLDVQVVEDDAAGDESPEA